jgi:uncharacterized membrane protein
MDIVALLSRWLHIASAVFLVGSALFGRFVLAPAADALDSASRADFDNRVAARFRTLVNVAMLLAVVSGLYNFLAKDSYPPGYHMAFGIKMLLTLHVFAVSAMLGKTGLDPAKRSRMTAGVAISGLAILALGAWLRSLQ